MKPEKVYMNLGYTANDVLKLNKELGGSLRNLGSVEFAIAAGKKKPDIRKLALLWRAILTDHPFDDANKRTIELITREYTRSKKYHLDTQKLVREILKVSKNNITDLKKIERRIKYATTGN